MPDIVKRKQSQQRWRAKNKKHLAERQALRRAKNPDKTRAEKRAWYAKNIDKARHQHKLAYQRNKANVLLYNKQKVSVFSDLMSNLKSNPCTDCGGTYKPCAMEYDHVRGVKKCRVSAMAHCTPETLQAELSKCELVCCVCHRIRTQIRRTPTQNPRLLAYHAWIDLLKAAPCLDCSRTYPPVAMDFDHVRGEKVSGIARMWSWRRERVLAELAKCDLVCANCHRVRTYGRSELIAEAA